MKRPPLTRRTGAVCCVACGFLFASWGNLRSHWQGDVEPLWLRALRKRGPVTP